MAKDDEQLSGRPAALDLQLHLTADLAEMRELKTRIRTFLEHLGGTAVVDELEM